MKILCYHSIDRTGSLVSVNPSVFKMQMEYLKEKRYECISLQEAFDRLRAKEPLNERTIVVTFDDGFKNIYSEVFPLFKELGFKATVFLIPGNMGKTADWVNRDFSDILTDGSGGLDNEKMASRSRELFEKRFPYYSALSQDQLLSVVEQMSRISALPILSWQEVKELSQYGFDFGAHSWSHRFLTELSPRDVKEEIKRSKTEIETRLNKPVSSFCYPYGIFNSAVRNIVKDLDFTGACSTYPGINNVGNCDLFTLKRISIDLNCGYFKYRLYQSPFYIYYSLWKHKDGSCIN